jgi:hypothetical protein
MEERSLSGACSSLELSSAPHHLNYEVQYPYGEPAISGRIYPCRGMVLTVLYLTVPVDKEGGRGAPTTSALCGDQRDPSVGGSCFLLLFAQDARGLCRMESLLSLAKHSNTRAGQWKTTRATSTGCERTSILHQLPSATAAIAVHSNEGSWRISTPSMTPTAAYSASGDLRGVS